MAFSSFLIVLFTAYFFYYAIVFTLDKISTTKPVSVSSNVGFVVAPAPTPAKVSIDESFQKYMPVIEEQDAEDNSDSEADHVENNLQAMIRMETFTDVEPEEIDGEELMGLMI